MPSHSLLPFHLRKHASVVVSNHRSYLDALFFTFQGCTHLAKAAVARVPLFKIIARALQVCWVDWISMRKTIKRFIDYKARYSLYEVSCLQMGVAVSEEWDQRGLGLCCLSFSSSSSSLLSFFLHFFSLFYFSSACFFTPLTFLNSCILYFSFVLCNAARMSVGRL